MNKIIGVWIIISAWVSIVLMLFFKPKVLQSKYFARYMLSFFCVTTILLFLSEYISLRVVQYVAAFTVVVLSVILLIDCMRAIIVALQKVISFHYRSMKPVPPYLNELTKGIEILLQRHLGGLIIIERKDTLEKYLGGGISFDAQVKAEIIAALFEKTSPVHDGGLIIKEGRIKTVKAILPIQTKTTLPLGMGTRHRAAVGLTETTDAIALVISEERKRRALVVHGELIDLHSQKECLDYIQKALKGKKRRGGRCLNTHL